MTIKHDGHSLGTMHVESLDEDGLYKAATPQATARDIDSMLQAHRKREQITFTNSPMRHDKEGYVYQIGRRGHWLMTYIVVPEERST